MGSMTCDSKTYQFQKLAKVKSRSNQRGWESVVVVSGHVCLPTWRGALTSFSDLHEYLGGPGLCPTTPHPITGETVPLTMGHEFSGIIEEVGECVTDWTVGDRVSVQPIIYDGTCGACQENLHNCCYSNGFIGLSGMDA